MPIFRVRVKVSKTYTQYVIAHDKEEALQVPKRPDWYPGDEEVPEVSITTHGAVEIKSADEVDDPTWLDALPWGWDPAETLTGEQRTVRECLAVVPDYSRDGVNGNVDGN